MAFDSRRVAYVTSQCGRLALGTGASTPLSPSSMTAAEPSMLVATCPIRTVSAMCVDGQGLARVLKC
jgi:hypothetical protein